MESGRKIITTFTDGVMSVASKPIEAVKGVFQKIRNLMPFSDAKEGPLSELTLSGRRVFETFDAGMQQSATLPAQTADKAFVDVGASTTPQDGGAIVEGGKPVPGAKQTVIQQVIFKVAVKDIESLKKVEALIHEFEDAINSGDPDPEPIPA